MYDGYVVNAIMDACYRSAESRQWESVELEWRHGSSGTHQQGSRPPTTGTPSSNRRPFPTARRKMILKDKDTGDFVDRIVAGG